MNNFLLKAWFGAILSLLGSLFPSWLTQGKPISSKPAVMLVAKAPQVRVSQKPAAAVKPAILCAFTGKAMYEGLPYGNAKLVFWITTPKGQEIRQLQTAADGTYSLKVAVSAKANEPVDWEIQGQTADLKMVHLSGRQIILGGESTLAVENPLEFIAG